MSWSAVINKPKLQRDLMHENKNETYISNGIQQISCDISRKPGKPKQSRGKKRIRLKGPVF